MASGGNSCESCLPPRGAFPVNSECVTKFCQAKVLEFRYRANGRRMSVDAK